MIQKPNYLIDRVHHINNLIDKGMTIKETKETIYKLPGPWMEDDYCGWLSPTPIWCFVEGAIDIAYVLKYSDEILEEIKLIQPY